MLLLQLSHAASFFEKNLSIVFFDSTSEISNRINDRGNTMAGAVEGAEIRTIGVEILT